MIIKKEFTIDFGHRLPNHQWKCFNVHWHTYRIILMVEWDLQQEWPERWMVVDFGNLKPIKQRLEDNWDHWFVYMKWDKIWDTIKEQWYKTYELEMDPTAENMAKFIVDMFPLLSGVEIYETPTSSALYLRK